MHFAKRIPTKRTQRILSVLMTVSMLVMGFNGLFWVGAKADGAQPQATAQDIDGKGLNTPSGEFGDVNMDGVFSSLDLTVFAQHLAGWNVTVDEKAMDANGDGIVTSLDLTLLSQWLAGWNVIVFYDGIANHEHTFVTVEGKEPNCTEIGWKSYKYCTSCKKTTYEELPAYGHSWSGMAEDLGADGHRYTCQRGCGAVTETAAHTYENGVCLSCGQVDGTQMVDSENLYYIKTGEGLCRLTSIGDCTDTIIHIPTYCTEGDCAGCMVVGIGEYAFSGCDTIQFVTIPDSVETVGAGAFYECSSLVGVKFGNGVMQIGEEAFLGCVSLKDIAIPDYVSCVERATFMNCVSLSHILFGSGCTMIDSEAFINTASLGSIEVSPDNFFFISDGNCLLESWFGALQLGCKNSVIPDNGTVSSIGAHAFEGSTVSRIVIPDGVLTIEANAFARCYNLTEVTVPESVVNIGAGAFEDDFGATLYCVSSAPKSGWDTAWNITNLKTVWNYGKHVISFIADGKTVATVAIQSADMKPVLPAVPEKDGFIGMWEDFTVKDEDFTVCAVYKPYSNGLNFVSAGDGTCTVAGIGTCTGEGIYIPPVSPAGDTVTGIGNNAFDGCAGITEVKIPATVTTIGASAFNGCTGLREILISDSVTAIGANALAGCTGMTVRCEVLTAQNGWSTQWNPDSLPVEWRYGKYVVTFYNEMAQVITRITYSAGDTSVREPAVPAKYGYYGTWLPYTLGTEDVDVYPNYLPYSTGLSFASNGDGTCAVDGINVCFAMDLIIPPYSPNGDKVVGIKDNVFNSDTMLNTVVIPEGVTYIGSKVFEGCTELSQVTLPDSLISIGEGAFAGCDNLTEIRIPAGMTVIGYGAFKNMYKLTSVVIPATVKTIGSYAFANCSELNEAVIAEGVQSVGEYAFSNCPKLTEVTIPSTVTYIGSNAFKECTNMTTVKLNACPARLYKNTFYWCFGLETVEFNGTVSEWNGINKDAEWVVFPATGFKVVCTDGNVTP